VLIWLDSCHNMNRMFSRSFLWVFILLTCVVLDGHAQKQANIWHFGRFAGLDFNGGSPTPLLDGRMNTNEGCASIADTNGNLLFYTDGIKVWNAAHQQMPNGFGMTGDPSSSQSGVIVPKPGDPNIYFIFTVAARIGRLDYSTVDMSEQGGLGDVVTKNVPLLSRSTEKISAVLHQNGQDIWVVGHEWANDEFYAWRITNAGVNATPVITSVGSVHSGGGDEAIGYIKFSPNNEKLAVAGFGRLNFVEVFDFDNATGTLTFQNQYTGFGASGAYGVEFSPNSKYLYIAERAGYTSLYQVEVGAPSGLIATAATWSFTGYDFGALQLATDGKIYMAQERKSYLGVIHEPDELGTNIQFELVGPSLGGNTSTLGLPTFIQSYFRRPNFTVDDHCFGEVAALDLDPDDEADFDSLLWDFGDPASGILNSSTDLNPTHLFSDSGTYEVTLTGYLNGTNLVRTSEVTVFPLPEFALGNDQVLVRDETLEISVAQNGNTYLWNDGNDANNRILATPGWHWLDGTNAFNCTIRDSVAIFSISLADTCFSATTNFNLEVGNISLDSVRWGFGDANTGPENSSTLQAPTHVFSAPGDYEVSLSINYQGEQIARNFTVTIADLPDAGLPSSVTLINDDTQTFSTGSLITTWENGGTDNSRIIRDPGWHWADLENAAGCTSRDSIAVFNMVYADTCFTANTRIDLETGNISVDSVHWNLGDAPGGAGNFQTGTSIDHEFSAPGNYNIDADIYYNGVSLNTQFNITITPLPAFDLGAERTLFYGESERLSVAGSGTGYLWQNGTTDDNLLVDSPGLYWVEVVNAAGCSFRDSVQINYDQIINVSLARDTLLCPEQVLPLDVTLPGASYRWQDGSNEATFTVTSPGVYWVEITNAFQNRTLTDSIRVDYYAFNEIEIVAQRVICFEQSIELVASGAKEGEIYLWYDENMNLLPENSGTFTTPLLSANTNYFVSLTNGQCESDRIGISVIYDMVTAKIYASDTIVNLGDPVYLDGEGGETFLWSPPQWLNQTESPSVVSIPEEDIRYTLTVTGAFGCTDTESVDLYVKRALYIPDAFSPNGDGYNDTFEVVNLERFPDNRVEIYNRLNKLVFTFKGYKNEWDGTLNGVYMPGNTFVYVIYRFEGDKHPERGSVRIMR